MVQRNEKKSPRTGAPDSGAAFFRKFNASHLALLVLLSLTSVGGGIDLTL